MDVQLNQVNIVVRDMEAMAAFYRRLGVDLRDGPSEWAPHHRNTGANGVIDIDLDSETFASMWNRGWQGGPGIVLGFRVSDRDAVDRLFEQLRAEGYAVQQEPYDAFWGSRYAIVADPDGNAVGLMSPPEDAHRTAPPTPPPLL